MKRDTARSVPGNARSAHEGIHEGICPLHHPERGTGDFLFPIESCEVKRPTQHKRLHHELSLGISQHKVSGTKVAPCRNHPSDPKDPREEHAQEPLWRPHSAARGGQSRQSPQGRPGA
ncbi:hypothetical protein X805_05800 [Sphaerotilus natans subsp. natans DSM 6575]|uniref:Uncharacterized protein n=1 Tax=Sphaerotilus natans subsp. natans DSM 6575 TaxID=1286631 RepID=A0A059KQY9_9BURK|nr:hypothetical protein X805_05800 [Sphaerotilus natans subsp. natans DSM 6575]